MCWNDSVGLCRWRSHSSPVWYTPSLSAIAGQLREQLEAARWSREEEVRRLKEEFDAERRELQRSLRKRDEEAESTRAELASTYAGGEVGLGIGYIAPEYIVF